MHRRRRLHCFCCRAIPLPFRSPTPPAWGCSLPPWSRVRQVTQSVNCLWYKLINGPLFVVVPLLYRRRCSPGQTRTTRTLCHTMYGHRGRCWAGNKLTAFVFVVPVENVLATTTTPGFCAPFIDLISRFYSLLMFYWLLWYIYYNSVSIESLVGVLIPDC